MKYIGYVFALLIIAFCGWLVWVFISNFQDLDKNIQASLIGVLGVLVVGIITHYQTKKREINARHFSEKREGYMHIIDLIFDLMMSEKEGKKLNEKQMLKKIIPFKKALLVWGSAEFIKVWDDYETNATTNQEPEKIFKQMDLLLRAIRKDLGHDDSTLEEGMLLGLFLNAEAKQEMCNKTEEKALPQPNAKGGQHE